MDATDDTLRALHDGLVSRERPETVAAALHGLPAVAADPALLRLIARRRAPKRSSMPDTWFEPKGLGEKIRVAQALFAGVIAASDDPRARIDPDEADPRRVGLFIAFLSESLGKAPTLGSFRFDRLDRETRAQVTGLGNHAYNKRFRLLNRMSDHLRRYRDERRFVGYRIAGKVGLVADLPFETFARDPLSAAFVAYHAARKRRRSLFTAGRQEGAFDDLCAALLTRAEAGTPDWATIARTHPEPAILARLDDEGRGALIGGWLSVLRALADDLEALWRRSDIDLATMIVRRGNDSSRWNIAAQAWNAARTAWIGVQQSMGMDDVLERFLPGKVLRLMAGDVAGWHRGVGGGLHPDTRVWADLPFPWEVMRGRASCDRAMIVRACRRHGVDPVKGGWVAPTTSRAVHAYRPTPELVHGVEVASPELASVLRAAGAFSGKPLRPEEEDAIH